MFYRLRLTINSHALFSGLNKPLSSARQILNCCSDRIKTVTGSNSAFRHTLPRFFNTDIATSYSNTNFRNWLCFYCQPFVMQRHFTLSVPHIYLYNSKNSNSYLMAVMPLLVQSKFTRNLHILLLIDNVVENELPMVWNWYICDVVVSLIVRYSCEVDPRYRNRMDHH